MEASAEVVQTSTSGNYGNLVSQAGRARTCRSSASRGRNPPDLICHAARRGLRRAPTGGGIYVHGARDRAWNYTLDGIDVNDSSQGGSSTTSLPRQPGHARRIPGSHRQRHRGIRAQQRRTGRHGHTLGHQPVPRRRLLVLSHAAAERQRVAEQPGRRWARRSWSRTFSAAAIGGPIKNKTFFFVEIQGLRARIRARHHRARYSRHTARQGILRYVKGGRNQPSGAPRRLGRCQRQSAARRQHRHLQRRGQRPAAHRPRSQHPAGDQERAAAQQLHTPATDSTRPGYIFSAQARSGSTIRPSRSTRLSTARTRSMAHRLGQRRRFATPPTPASRLPRRACPVNTVRRPRNLAFNWRYTPTARDQRTRGRQNRTARSSISRPRSTKSPSPPLRWTTPSSITSAISAWSARGSLWTTSRISGAPIPSSSASICAGSRGRSARLGRRPERHGGSQLLHRHQHRGPDHLRVAARISTPPSTGPISSPISISCWGAWARSIAASSIRTASTPRAPSTSTRAIPEYEFYGQDTWKVRKNLTVDIGLRWEIRLSPNTPEATSWFRTRRWSPAARPAIPSTGFRDRCSRTSWHNFGPSLGFAWDPFGTGKTSIRANYRIAYDRINTS